MLQQFRSSASFVDICNRYGVLDSWVLFVQTAWDVATEAPQTGLIHCLYTFNSVAHKDNFVASLFQGGILKGPDHDKGTRCLAFENLCSFAKTTILKHTYVYLLLFVGCQNMSYELTDCDVAVSSPLFPTVPHVSLASGSKGLLYSNTIIALPLS